MKALISGFALLTFLAATTLPFESYAQTSPGGATTMAPDTGTAPTSTTKKSKKSSKSSRKEKIEKIARHSDQFRQTTASLHEYRQTFAAQHRLRRCSVGHRESG